MISHYKSRGAVYFNVELSRSSSLCGSLPSMKNRAVTMIDHVTEKWFLFVFQVYYSFRQAGSLLGVNFKPPLTRNEEEDNSSYQKFISFILSLLIHHLDNYKSKNMWASDFRKALYPAVISDKAKRKALPLFYFYSRLPYTFYLRYFIDGFQFTISWIKTKSLV